MIDFKHVLCPVDFSEHSARTVDHALALAAWYETRLTLLHVHLNRAVMDVPPLTLTPEERARLRADMRALVGAPPPGVAIDYCVREASDARREIVGQLADTGADLLVIGSHGRSGIHTFLLGSVTEYVIREARCPVLVVPRRAPDADPTSPVRFDRILCPVDFSDESLKALGVALALAQETSAHLLVLHVIERRPMLDDDVPATRAEIMKMYAAAEAEALQRLRARIPPDARTYCMIETQARDGAAYREILAAAAEDGSDLIVMGVQGRGAVNRLLFGSNTARVMRAATCPVLTVRLG